MDNKVKKPSVERVVFISFLVDISDLLVNVFIAILSGSVVMFSQALQGGSDLVSSTLLLIGVHRSKRKTDKNYPFGNGRELYFWNMMAAMVMLGVTATLSIVFGYRRFLHPESINAFGLSLAVLTLALFTNSYSFYLSAIKLLKGHKINTYFRILKNSPFIEIKTVFVQDLMGAVASAIGIISLLLYNFADDARFDGIGAISIGIVLVLLSVFLLDGIRQMIVGRSASEQTEKKIRHATLVLAEVEEVIDLKTMYLGANQLLVNLEVQVIDKLTTTKIEKLINKIESNIKNEIPAVTHIQVELKSPKR